MNKVKLSDLASYKTYYGCRCGVLALCAQSPRVGCPGQHNTGLVAHPCTSSTWKVKAGGSEGQVPGYPGLQNPIKKNPQYPKTTYGKMTNVRQGKVSHADRGRTNLEDTLIKHYSLDINEAPCYRINRSQRSQLGTSAWSQRLTNQNFATSNRENLAT